MRHTSDLARQRGDACARFHQARHGTTTETRLTVIDRVPADDPTAFPALPGTAADMATLLDWVTRHVPRRAVLAMRPATARATAPIATKTLRAGLVPNPGSQCSSAAKNIEPAGVALTYDTVDWKPAEGGRITDALHEGYALQSIRIPGSQAHPTRLVQSAAMASVAPPKPAYRPHLPANLVSEGLLSDAQLESVIYAGEAHSGFLASWWTVDDTFDLVSAAADDAENAVCALESGPPDRHPYIHIPAGFIQLIFNDAYTWQFKTEPSPNVNGRSVNHPGRAHRRWIELDQRHDHQPRSG